MKYYVTVNSAQLSKFAQRQLFNAGYKWRQSGQKLVDAPTPICLVINTRTMHITKSQNVSFVVGEHCKEISYEDLLYGIIPEKELN